LLAKGIMLCDLSLLFRIRVQIFESELVVDAVKLLPDLMHTLVIALLVVLGVDQEAMTSINVLADCFQVDLQAALSS